MPTGAPSPTRRSTAGDGAAYERRYLEAAGSLAPRVLGSSARVRSAGDRATGGCRLDSLHGAEFAAARSTASARRWRPCTPPVPCRRSDSRAWTRSSSRSAVGMIARARPDAGPPPPRVLAALLDRRDDGAGARRLPARRRDLRNAIATAGRVALLDLERRRRRPRRRRPRQAAGRAHRRPRHRPHQRRRGARVRRRARGRLRDGRARPAAARRCAGTPAPRCSRACAAGDQPRAAGGLRHLDRTAGGRKAHEARRCSSTASTRSASGTSCARTRCAAR